MATAQAASNKEKIKAVSDRERARNTNSARPDQAAQEEDKGSIPNWRAGNFGEDVKPKKNKGPKLPKDPSVPLFQEEQMPKPAQRVCYGLEMLEEKKISKHAKRRANKKAKQAAAAEQAENGAGSQAKPGQGP